ncbi:MAG: hypothetical protein RL565_1470 [Pseudomonadota bacterium]
MVVFPDVLPCELEAPEVVLPTDPPAPPADVEAPVVKLPTDPPVPPAPPAEVEAPVDRLPTLETELLRGLLVTAPPVVPPVVLTVI